MEGQRLFHPSYLSRIWDTSLVSSGIALRTTQKSGKYNTWSDNLSVRQYCEQSEMESTHCVLVNVRRLCLRHQLT